MGEKAEFWGLHERLISTQAHTNDAVSSTTINGPYACKRSP